MVLLPTPIRISKPYANTALDTFFVVLTPPFMELVLNWATWGGFSINSFFDFNDIGGVWMLVFYLLPASALIFFILSKINNVPVRFLLIFVLVFWFGIFVPNY